MGQVMFCKTRYFYQPYVDFWNLVALSGYPTIYVDELDPQSDNTYIVTPLNGEWKAGWQDPKARIIHWDLEWRAERQEILGIEETWASDTWYANKNHCRYVMLGSHPGMNAQPNEMANKAYDVAMLASMNFRRGHMVDLLQEEGVRVGCEAWSDERHKMLISSKAYVYVCQHEEYPAIAPQRWALAAAYHLPIISENVADPGPFRYFGLWADYQYIPYLVRARLNDCGDYGWLLYNFLCVHHPFKRCVEEAV